MHSFADQMERLLVCILLMVFGGAVAKGILAPLTWELALVAIAFLLVIRPLTGLLGLSTSKMEFKEKLAISFFGIRGMGSIFYLAFAIKEFGFERQNELWAIISLTILLSITIHGITANWAMKHLKNTVAGEK